MSDWYSHSDEHPTMSLRWNTYNARTAPVLEQLWKLRVGDVITDEWRPVSFVEQPTKD